ncbi:DUF4123 domain-containing protein [Pokkaliibacter sp. CJK22405]|uniref:DUF4123 domain-containing protein n=1 Tax=Pokkaliibacter sp. CJK22405 TaxID=3384615 RepID=UPI0039853184
MADNFIIHDFQPMGDEFDLKLDSHSNICLVIDTARVDHWLNEISQIEDQLNWENLYENTQAEEYKSIAPVVVDLYEKSELISFVNQNAIWSSSTVLITYHCSFDEIVDHLRSLVFVRDKNRKNLFRFYSPQLLSYWISTLPEESIHSLLGPAERWIWKTNNHLDQAQVWNWILHKPEQKRQKNKTAWFELSQKDIEILNDFDKDK